MCGITAYLGHRQVLEILLRGLQRLEYRYVRGAAPAGNCTSGTPTPRSRLVPRGN